MSLPRRALPLVVGERGLTEEVSDSSACLTSTAILVHLVVLCVHPLGGANGMDDGVEGLARGLWELHCAECVCELLGCVRDALGLVCGDLALELLEAAFDEICLGTERHSLGSHFVQLLFGGCDALVCGLDFGPRSAQLVPCGVQALANGPRVALQALLDRCVLDEEVAMHPLALLDTLDCIDRLLEFLELVFLLRACARGERDALLGTLRSPVLAAGSARLSRAPVVA